MTTTRRQKLIYRVSGYPGVRERKVAKDKTKPGTPTGLAAEIVSSTIVDLTWNAASDPVVPGQSTSGVKGYRVFRNSTRIADLGPVLTYTDTGRTPGAQYRYAVASVDNRNNQSVLSPQVAVTMPATGEPIPPPEGGPDVTAPTVPQGLSAVVQGETQINLTWTASTDPTVADQERSGVAGYKVYRDGAQVATVALVPSYQDTGLQPGTDYSYTVRAVDVAGNQSAASGAVGATTAESGGGGDTGTITAASASRADVLAAIAQANAGDTVVVPAGSASWSGGITLSGITLRGPGKAAGSPTNVSAGLVTITKHATELTRLIGFRFTGTDQHLQIGGSVSARAFVIDDCHFHNAGSEWCNMTTNGGLFCRNTITAPSPHSADVFRINLGGPGGAGLASWQAAHTMGTADTTGETNTYFEDNHWTNLLEVCVDVDNGGRVVMRHERFQDSSVVYHGGGSGSSGQDTSSYGGRHLEMYDCTFDRVDQGGSSALNKWIWVRGGGGFVFANNDVDVNHTGQYPNKREIILSCGCPGSPAYPMQYQVGQSTQSPDATPNHPALIYGNTGSGAGAELISISGQNGAGITCGNPGNYIQLGRDYQTSNTWGWAKYPYPHPLRP